MSRPGSPRRLYSIVDADVIKEEIKVSFIAPLSDFGRDDVVAAGGKGANLGELVRAGLSVPNGFVITTDAYLEAIQPLDREIAERVDSSEVASIRSVVESALMPADLRTEVAGAYAELGGGPVAVRSSATTEDLPGAAFAGQHDTYLNVVGEDALIDAVLRCWGSLWTERASAYRSRIKIDSAAIKMAVVVQSMINAEVAGVMFTADPVTGDRHTIMVDASTGLGEAVVSGSVTPDHYLLDDQGRIRHFQPGEPSSTKRLPDHVLEELARLGTTVATLFGRPQDIEWAYADDHVWLLQARPMTALPPPPITLNRLQRRLASVFLDYFPVRPYPNRHEHLGASWTGGNDGIGRREIRHPRGVRWLPLRR
jgi:rifampicin phosphotransferase